MSCRRRRQHHTRFPSPQTCDNERMSGRWRVARPPLPLPPSHVGPRPPAVWCPPRRSPAAEPSLAVVVGLARLMDQPTHPGQTENPSVQACSPVIRIWRRALERARGRNTVTM